MGVHSDYLLDTPLSRAPLSTCLRVTTRNRIDTTRLSTCFTAFSPDPDSAPIHDDLPFNLVRGEVVLDETAYDRYLDVLPIRQVHGAREALRNLRGLALGVGLGDQFIHIPTGTLELSQRFGVERISHRLDVHAGDHRQRVGERLESLVLPWIGDRLIVSE